jgi:hypothetical protein
MAGAELRPQLSDAGRVFAAAAAAVDRLPASPAGPNVNRLYGESVALDRAWIDLTVAALDMPPGPLAQQVARAGARSRELADRVFDRGRALLVPVLPTTTVPGIEVVLPPDVPDWVAEGLAPGPPLDDPPPSPAATPLVRVAHRPQQSVPSWLRAVAASGAPSLADLDRALAAADASTLQSLSRRWQSAVDRMRAQPDPRGDRERADRLYLQWLVAAEAARVGQASRVIGGDLGSRLNELAIRLAGVARRA